MSFSSSIGVLVPEDGMSIGRANRAEDGGTVREELTGGTTTELLATSGSEKVAKMTINNKHKINNINSYLL